MAKNPSNEEMPRIVESAIAALEREWQTDIKDPSKAWLEAAANGDPAPETRRWAERIERYIRQAGRVWARILDARKGPPYYRTSDAWCGFFVNYGFARGYLEPGAPPFKLHPRISEIIMPSTLRINSRAHWLRAGYLIPLNGQTIKPSEIKRGDVVTIMTNRTDPKAYGDHYVLALSSVDSDGFFDTIEGNAEGRKPTGPDTRQGVIKNRRSVGRVRRVYRFEPRHFVSAE